MVIGSLEEPKEAYVVAEQVVLRKVSITNSLVALLSAFYVLNIEFPYGLTTILEILFLNQHPKKMAIIVSQVISLLKQ